MRNCTGVVWLASSAAIALSVLCVNVAICKLIAWSSSLYIKCTRNLKTHPEGEIVCRPPSSPVSP